MRRLSANHHQPVLRVAFYPAGPTFKLLKIPLTFKKPFKTLPRALPTAAPDNQQSLRVAPYCPAAMSKMNKTRPIWLAKRHAQTRMKPKSLSNNYV